jgi:hypothetical protein
MKNSDIMAESGTGLDSRNLIRIKGVVLRVKSESLLIIPITA